VCARVVDGPRVQRKVHTFGTATWELVVPANPMHIRNIPDRNSDVNDATRIADLLARGLIRGSAGPPAPIHRLPDLTLTRKQSVREIRRHTLRQQKTLEDANIKLTGPLRDVLGESGRAGIAGQDLSGPASEANDPVPSAAPVWPTGPGEAGPPQGRGAIALAA